MSLLCPFLNKPCIEAECNLWSIYRLPANDNPKYGPSIPEDIDLTTCAFLAVAHRAQADMAMKIAQGIEAGRELGYIESNAE